MPKLEVNDNFFKNWSPDMAYVLGLITADGCLIKHKNGHRSLDITLKDKRLLEDIKKLLNSEHKIGKKTRGYRLQIKNKTLYNDLYSLGLTPRKSKTIRFPAVPPKYLSDFVRGYFDGDGSVCVWKEKRWKNSLQIRTTFVCGSLPFLKSLKTNLSEYGELDKGKIWGGNKSNRAAYELHYGINDSLRLFNFIYKPQSFPYLSRKKQKFEFFIKSKNNFPSARVAVNNLCQRQSFFNVVARISY